MDTESAADQTGIKDPSGTESQGISLMYRSRTADPTGYWKRTFDMNNPMEADDYHLCIEGDLMVYPGPNPDLRNVSVDRQAFARAAKTRDGIADGFAHRLWLFMHGVEIGDWVVLDTANPAIGQISGPCVFEDGSYRREAQWHWIADSPIGGTPISKAVRGRNLWGFTTLEPIEFKRIVQALGQESLVNLDHIPEPPTKVERKTTASSWGVADIASRFASEGLNYTNTQIADFYTALQTKGFVVLSGISGTGKSKIAQVFANLFPRGSDSALSPHVLNDDGASLRLHPYSYKYSSIVIPVAHQRLFPIVTRDQAIPVSVHFEGSDFVGRLYRDNVLNLSWRKELKAKIAEIPVGTMIWLIPRYSDSSVDAGSLTQIDFEVVHRDPLVKGTETAPNTLFLPVRPDWRDSTSLLGYYNPLTQTYEWTDFLRFILNAADNYRGDTPVAWFVILDEMNLAHVEYYFADLLSVLESGRNTDAADETNYGFTREPLRLTYPDDIVNEAPQAEIYLPPNLYIIGTVNMDETTHAFSPKVLDRAFTMELTEVDFTGYPGAIKDTSSAAVSDAEKHNFLQAFSQDGAFPQIRKLDIHAYVESNPEIRESLQRLNSALAVYRHHFGYRVFDEIVQFLANAERNGMYADRHTALDSAVFMKVLPKFSGSEARVGRPLAALIAWAQDPLAEGDGAEALKRTLARATYMQEILQAEGFVTAF